jgi:hypothetical protein
VKFYTKFQETATKIRNLPESEMVFIFEQALKSKTKYEVIKARPFTLNEAIGVASRFEECCGDRQPFVVGQAKIS